jgi:hypothetical protein
MVIFVVGAELQIFFGSDVIHLGVNHSLTQQFYTSKAP